MRFPIDITGKSTAKNALPLLIFKLIKEDQVLPADRTCLHCGKKVEERFCSYCGQKISTTRFRLHQLLSTDLIHGLYNLNPGIMNTLYSLASRPGHAIREYVQGKRADFLNYLSFFILAITFAHFVHDYSHLQIDRLFVTRVNRSLLAFHDSFLHNNGKIFAFMMTPLVSLCSYLVFKQAGQNYAEHCVMNFFKASASLILVSLFYTLAIVFSNHIFLKIAYVCFFLFQMGYELIFYVQYFTPFAYSRKSLLLRSLFVTLFSTALLIDKWVIVF